MDPEKSKLINKDFHLFAKGNTPFVDIARFLHRHGLTNARSGKPMKIDYVKEMLANRFYIGIMKYGGEYHEGTHPVFISKELFAAVQKQIERRIKPRKRKDEFYFTGVIKCGECGASITAETHRKYYKRTDRTADYVYYRCTKNWVLVPKNLLLTLQSNGLTGHKHKSCNDSIFIVKV